MAIGCCASRKQASPRTRGTFALVVNDLNEVAVTFKRGRGLKNRKPSQYEVQQGTVADNAPIQQTARWVIDTMTTTITTSITLAQRGHARQAARGH
jgi:hypothetical protein